MFHSVTELVDESLCSNDEDSKYHKLECIKRQCDDCGIKIIQLLDAERENDSEHIVTWKCYAN